MNDPNRVDQLIDDYTWIVGTTHTGTADRTTRIRRIDLALQHIHEWTSTRTPNLHTGERGGTTTPTQITERLEDQTVHRQAIRDAQTLPGLWSQLTPIGQALKTARIRDASRARHLLAHLAYLAPPAGQAHTIVARYVNLTDHTRLPTTGPSGCASCARTKRDGNRVVIAPRWTAVSETKRAADLGLCSWCYNHRHDGEWPAHELVDLYARSGGKAVAKYLARIPVTPPC